MTVQLSVFEYRHRKNLAALFWILFFNFVARSCLPRVPASSTPRQKMAPWAHTLTIYCAGPTPSFGAAWSLSYIAPRTNGCLTEMRLATRFSLYNALCRHRKVFHAYIYSRRGQLWFFFLYALQEPYLERTFLSGCSYDLSPENWQVISNKQCTHAYSPNIIFLRTIILKSDMMAAVASAGKIALFFPTLSDFRNTH